MRARTIVLPAVPAALLLAAAAGAPRPPYFVASDRCVACHQGLADPRGDDVSIGTEWRSTVMANASRDPYWQASVRRETLIHPSAAADIENECSACHMPMAQHSAAYEGRRGLVFAHLPFAGKTAPADLLAADGVSCSVCHQIRPDNFGTFASFNSGFVLDLAPPPGRRAMFGRFEVDPGRQALMHSSADYLPKKAAHVGEAELCATCHQLYTHALDGNGKEIGQLPEQVPYSEWKHSAYKGARTCQSCHMPEADGATPLTAVRGRPRSPFLRHSFRGGNGFLLRTLNLRAGDLDAAAEPLELDAAAAQTERQLMTEAAAVAVRSPAVEGGAVVAEIEVRNLTGHKLPSAYPSRRAWLHVTVRDALDRLVFESGRPAPDGSIAGNDNDADAGRFEPHRRTLETPDQVQVYESMMVDPEGAVTTVLLSGVRYVKDNRLLPDGFDKATAPDDVAVAGDARDDPDFAGGGDRVRLGVKADPAAGPFRIAAELWYQPVGFRWAHNLERNPTAEGARFVSYYDALAKVTGVLLARDEAVTR